jgi:hypothetical protein
VDFFSGTIERKAICLKVAILDGQVGALHAIRRRAHPQQNTGIAWTNTLKGCVETGILERPVEHQPTGTARARSFADNLALIGAPVGLSQGVPSGEG